MKKSMVSIFALALVFWAWPLGFAAEHGGTAMPQEHGGTTMMKEQDGSPMMKEDGGSQMMMKDQEGMVMKMPSADDIHAAMKSYIDEKSKATGTFDVADSETGKTRTLTLEKIHDRVGKTGDYYYSCADFKDTVSGDLLDLDLDVQDKDAQLSVVDVRIHKINGKERYTYDENGNRIPMPADK